MKSLYWLRKSYSDYRNKMNSIKTERFDVVYCKVWETISIPFVLKFLCLTKPDACKPDILSLGQADTLHIIYIVCP